MNALINNQEEMIYFLYDNYKFQKPSICHRGYPTQIRVNEQLISVTLENIHIPILLGAYEKKNFTLFCNLIDKYQENPDSEIVSPSGEFICNASLLQLLISENALPYAKKLLESGANPNKQNYFIQEWDADKKRLVPVTSLRFGGTTLHAPLSAEAVALLLEYKADTTTRDSEGYTAFGRAATIYPLNTKVIELLMATGKHSIDEPQGPQAITPLYCACEENDRKAAAYFIERGANILHPVEKGIGGIKIATPFALMVAIYKDVKITRKMIEQLEKSNNPGIRKEIQKILLMGVTDEIKSILTPFYKKLCLAAAEKEHNQSKYSVAASLYKEIFARCSPPKSETSSLWRSLGNSLTAANQLDEAKDAFDKSEAIELQSKMP
jgi:tetratricopeptide (TPR) repeat protein